MGSRNNWYRLFLFTPVIVGIRTQVVSFLKLKGCSLQFMFKPG